jgi:hypothetical protein
MGEDLPPGPEDLLVQGIIPPLLVETPRMGVPCLYGRECGELFLIDEDPDPPGGRAL